MNALEIRGPRESPPDSPADSLNSLIEEYALTGKIVQQPSDFVYDLDKDGLTPLHAAAAAGQIDAVRVILGIDKKLSRLKGTDGKTPVHVATMRGKTDVIREMVLSCVDCLEDETVQGQTALHLAVLHQEIGSVVAIVDLIKQTNQVDVFYKKDEQGNTALHLATRRVEAI